MSSDESFYLNDIGIISIKKTTSVKKKFVQILRISIDQLNFKQGLKYLLKYRQVFN
jgi:hypothetical protein